MILACDGIWDVFENNAAINFVCGKAELLNAAAKDRRKLAVAEICDDLLLECLKKGSRDNMTAILLMFYTEECPSMEHALVLMDSSPDDIYGESQSPAATDIEAVLREVSGDESPVDIISDDGDHHTEPYVPTRRKLFEQV